jgi:hypothetical protein
MKDVTTEITQRSRFKFHGKGNNTTTIVTQGRVPKLCALAAHWKI